MAEGLAYNAGNISGLADTLESKLGTFNGKIDELFSYIDRLKNEGYWTGSVYDAFKENIEAYRKEHIEPMVGEIKVWISTLRDTAADAEANTAKGIGIVG